MSSDDRLSRYLSHRSHQIPVPPAEPEAVYRRAARRTARRRVTAVGATAVFAVAAGVVAFGGSGSEPNVQVGPLASTPDHADTPFDWTVVEPQSGLAYANSSVVHDGSVYALSTAPGTTGQEQEWGPNALYRSSDGTEWDHVGLPDDLWPSSLTATDGSLYAVGTAPAGGDGRKLVVASSSDGADWQRVDLPLDLEAYDARVGIGQPLVATGPDGAVVAAVTMRAYPDIAEMLPPDVSEEAGGWTVLEDGVEVYASTDDAARECIVGDDGAIEIREAIEEQAADGDTPRTSVAGSNDDPLSGGAVGDEAGAPSTTMPPCADARGDVIGSYTWDELDVDPEVRDLMRGRTHLFRSTDGATFTAVDGFDGEGLTASALIGEDAGFRLVATEQSLGGQPSSIGALSSTDGATWVDDDLGLSDGQHVVTSGTLGGRAAVLTESYRSQPTSSVSIAEPGGGWSTIDLTGSLELDEGEQYFGTGGGAFGPLGLVVTVHSGVPQDGDSWSTSVRSRLVHLTPDGAQMSSVDVAELLGDGDMYGAAGYTVTADAVTVRLSEPGDGDPDTPPTQTLLVGTPKG